MRHSSLRPINDPDSAIGAGWFIEIDGRRVAELTEPMYVSESQFWYSYVIVPATDDPQEKERLFSLDFWTSGKIAFRSRKFGAIAPHAFSSMTPPDPETRRIIVRGLHLKLDPGPSIIEIVARLFKRH